MYFGKDMVPVRIIAVSTSRPYNAWIRRELVFKGLKPRIYTYLSYTQTEFDGKDISFKVINLYFTSLKEFKDSYMVVS